MKTIPIIPKYIPILNHKFDFSELENIKTPNIESVHNKYMDAYFEVIKKLLQQILNREPEKEDVCHLHFRQHETEPMISIVLWDDIYIGTIEPGYPQLCGYSFQLPDLTFTPLDKFLKA